jgi:hypothetical protein
MSEPVFMKLSMHILETESFETAILTNLPNSPSAFVSMKQWLGDIGYRGKDYPCTIEELLCMC